MKPVIISGRDPNLAGVAYLVERVVATEELHGRFRTGRAPDVEQQTGVIGLRCCFGSCSQPIDEPHREQGAPQTVLDGNPDREVRCQRQGSDHL